MGRLYAFVIVLAACRFDPGVLPPQDVDGSIDPDMPPPPSASVRFTQVTADITALAPGRYGFSVTAVLRNELDVDISDVAPTLTFTAGTTDRAGNFRWRDVDRREGVTVAHPRFIAAGGEAAFAFVVDALASAAPPGPIAINGAATFTHNGMSMSATPLDPPLSLPFVTLPAPIVVTTAQDETMNNGMTSLREALSLAATNPQPDRIVFSPSVFASSTTITLSDTLGELPTFDGAAGDLVIDGTGVNVTLAVTNAWEDDARYGLRQTGGTLVVAGLTFRNFGYNYRNEDVSSNNCGPNNQQYEGGAIRVSGGTLILDGNVFEDPNVAERNCYAALVRIHGGSGHRIVGNTWTNQTQDSIYINTASVREIVDNVMNAGANLARVDECIYIAQQGAMDLWLIGNICTDQEFSAIYAGGNDAGKLYVINNTFARNGRVILSAVRRGGTRNIIFRNNVYLANNPSAIAVDAAGSGFDIAYESTTNNPLCSPACSSAMIDTASMLAPANAMLANGSGSTPDELAPVVGSPLMNSGTDWVDRNGSLPHRYNDSGPERGAVETF